MRPRRSTPSTARSVGFWRTVKATLFTRYRDEEALRLLEEPQAPVNPLVQIAPPRESLQETRA